MSKNRKIILNIISVIIGLFFIFSSYAKTQPISPFIDYVYDTFNFNYEWAAILAKVLIGLEAALGISLLLGLQGKYRWVYYISGILIILFSIFIGYIWYTQGNEADCMCLGEVVKLSPLSSIIKNMILLVLLIILIVLYPNENNKNKNNFSIIITGLFICYPFVFYPSQIDMDKLYGLNNSTDLTVEAPPINIKEGKHIVAFLSFSCKHCREAAAIFSEMYKKDNSMPLLFVFSIESKENKELYNDFLKIIEGSNIPLHFIPRKDFTELAGKGVPSIYKLNGDIIINKIDNYKKIELKDLQEWYLDN